MSKYIFVFFLFLNQLSIAQLRVDIYPTEEFMVKEMLIGDSSVAVRNVKFIGSHDARGIFYNKETPLEISEGIILSTGHAISAQAPNKGVGYTTSNRTKGDRDLHFLAQFKTYDATYISFEFTPKENLIRFHYVFASEEYPEYVGSTFNDVFGFFLTDLETGEITNLAVIPNTETPITVNNINHKKNANFYIKNKEGTEALLEYDGLTKPLIAYSKVVPGRQYRIKIAIADVADDAFDSSVFLKGKSFKSEQSEVFFNSNTTYFALFNMTNSGYESKPTQTIPKKPTQKPTIKPTPVTSKSTPVDSLIVYFDFDKDNPTIQELNRLKHQLDKVNLKNYDVLVSGHTDQVGNYNYNKTLSVKRASHISKYLKNNYNITPTQVDGKSFTNLIYTGKIINEYKQNRRAVIYLRSLSKNTN